MKQLVYDVGMHNGDDTSQYLRRGCKVVAIEANPHLCERNRKRFSNEIAGGDLVMLNVGVTRQPGTLSFWICDDVTEWSSFDVRIASRNGSRHHAIDIDCLSMDTIMDRYGKAEYVKIDIEGNDRICLQSMRTDQYPRYISIEMDHDERGAQDIERLREMGYHKFKIICQNHLWADVTPSNRWMYGLGNNHRLNRTVRSLAPRLPLRLGRNSRLYRFGSSGPFGEDTCGRWRSYRETLATWAFLREVDKKLATRGLGWWFDIHATR